AGELYARSAAGFEELGDRMRLGIVRGNQAEVCAMHGDLRGAVEHAEECVSIAREVNDADGLVLALHTLARLMVRIGDMRRAEALFGECFVRARDLGYREALANCVQATADLMVSGAGDLQLAARLQSVAHRALDEIGVRLQGLEAESFARTARV